MAVSKTFSLLGIFCLLGFALAEKIDFQACPDEKHENGTVIPRNCVIHELRINPCAHSSGNKPCQFKRGLSAGIEFDFTTGVTLQNATHQAYWASELADLPLAGMDTKTCSFTSCPIQANKKQTFAQNLPLSSAFPVRNYDVKWELNNEEDGVLCCLMFKIKLVK